MYFNRFDEISDERLARNELLLNTLLPKHFYDIQYLRDRRDHKILNDMLMLLVLNDLPRNDEGQLSELTDKLYEIYWGIHEFYKELIE